MNRRNFLKIDPILGQFLVTVEGAKLWCFLFPLVHEIYFSMQQLVSWLVGDHPDI